MRQSSTSSSKSCPKFHERAMTGAKLRVRDKDDKDDKDARAYTD